jgi:transposase
LGQRNHQTRHQVDLIPAIKVKPFVPGNKNDANDALAIAEANLG